MPLSQPGNAADPENSAVDVRAVGGPERGASRGPRCAECARFYRQVHSGLWPFFSAILVLIVSKPIILCWLGGSLPSCVGTPAVPLRSFGTPTKFLSRLFFVCMYVYCVYFLRSQVRLGWLSVRLLLSRARINACHLWTTAVCCFLRLLIPPTTIVIFQPDHPAFCLGCIVRLIHFPCFC